MAARIYSASDIQRIVQAVGLNRLMDEAIASLSQACREFDPQSTTVPVRGGFSYSEPNVGLLEWMPAMKSGAEVCIKLVGYHPANPSERQLPTILSTALCFDAQTGALLTIMDATFLTALRTGAASAIASRILADPESTTLGLIGAGTQSITQLHALSRYFNLERVLVFDTDQTACDSFETRAERLGLKGIEFSVTSADSIVNSADIICTATSVGIGEGPVLRDVDPEPHLHINAVGSDFPGKLELPLSLLKRGLVCPDFRLQAIAEGECQQLQEGEIGPDLIALTQNESVYSPHRASISVFDSTGWALQDYFAVRLLTAHGNALGLGSEQDLRPENSDPKDPYGFLGCEQSTVVGKNSRTETISSANG